MVRMGRSRSDMLLFACVVCAVVPSFLALALAYASARAVACFSV